MLTYELVGRTLTGDPDAAKTLTRLLAPIFHREAQYAIWRERGTIEEVKELVNDIFADLCSERAVRLRRLTPGKEASPASYFRRFARLRCLGWPRDERDRLLERRSELADPGAEPGLLPAGGPEPEPDAGGKPLRIKEVLSPADFALLSRHSAEEIETLCAELGVSRPVYFQRLHRLLDALRQHGLLREEYRARKGGPEAGGPPDHKPLEFSLKSLEADVALEDLEQRERGQPPLIGSPLSQQDIEELRALTGDLGEDFAERKAAQLLSALQQVDSGGLGSRQLVSLDEARAKRAARTEQAAGAARAAGVARGRRLRRLGFLAAPVVAVGWLLFCWPVGPLAAVVQVPEVQDSLLGGAAADAGSEGAAPARITANGCLRVRVPLQGPVASRGLAAQTYLVSGAQWVRWELDLQPDPTGALSSPAGCQQLPSGVAGNAWELAVLVGYRGRLWWQAEAARRAMVNGKERGEYRGIQYVRRSLRWVAEPAARSK